MPTASARVRMSAMFCGCTSSAQKKVCLPFLPAIATVIDMASAAAVASSSRLAFAIGRAHRSEIIVWKLSSDCRRPCAISAWWRVRRARPGSRHVAQDDTRRVRLEYPMPMNDLYTLFAETMPLSRASASASVIGSSRSSSGLGSGSPAGASSRRVVELLKPHACRGEKEEARRFSDAAAPAPRGRARADLEHRRRVVADRANVPAREVSSGESSESASDGGPGLTGAVSSTASCVSRSGTALSAHQRAGRARWSARPRPRAQGIEAASSADCARAASLSRGQPVCTSEPI